MIFFIPRQTDAIYFPDKDNPLSYSWDGFDREKVDEYYVYLMFDGKECLAKISADKSILKGSKIKLGFSLDKVNLFDPISEKAIF